MSIVERDYLLRMIQRFAEALGRILGARNAGKVDEALRLVRETNDQIFGPLARTLAAVDAATAATLLSSKEKISMYAELLAEEAELHALSGDERRARSGRRHALELYLEVVLVSDDVDAKVRAAIATLRSQVDEGRLPERYRTALAAVLAGPSR